MAVHQYSGAILWAADFKPHSTTPKSVRAALNAWIRSDGYQGWLCELISSLHSLAVLLPDCCIVSTCGKYVASPVMAGAVLAVDVKRVSKSVRDDDYKQAPAWADAIAKYENSRAMADTFGTTEEAAQ